MALVEVESDREELILVLSPNRSMSWQKNKYLLAVMTLWSGAIGIGFLIIGAWVIMPFIGLELAALGGALYYVSWKLSHREILRINGDEVRVEKGIRWPKKSWRWSRQALRISVNVPNHPWQTPTILLTCEGRQPVRVGEFLNLDDCKILVDKLIASGLVTRRYARPTEVSF